MSKRGGVVCNEDAMCGEKIVEIGIFIDDLMLENGTLVRCVFDKPIHCEEGTDVSGSVSIRRHDGIQPEDGRSVQEGVPDE